MSKYHTTVVGHDAIETQLKNPKTCDIVGCGEDWLVKFKLNPTVNGKSLGEMEIKACRKHSAKMVALNYTPDEDSC